MQRQKFLIFLLLLIALCPFSGFAEIADKVPSFGFICWTSITIGLIGFFVSAFRIKLGIIALVIALIFSFIYSDLLSLSSSIINELGKKYLIAVYLSFPVMILPIILGTGIRLFKKSRKKEMN